MKMKNINEIQDLIYSRYKSLYDELESYGFTDFPLNISLVIVPDSQEDDLNVFVASNIEGIDAYSEFVDICSSVFSDQDPSVNIRLIEDDDKDNSNEGDNFNDIWKVE